MMEVNRAWDAHTIILLAQRNEWIKLTVVSIYWSVTLACQEVHMENSVYSFSFVDLYWLVLFPSLIFHRLYVCMCIRCCLFSVLMFPRTIWSGGKLWCDWNKYMSASINFGHPHASTSNRSHTYRTQWHKPSIQIGIEQG